MPNRDELAKPWWLLPAGRVHPLWWIGIGAVLIWLIFLAGPRTQFPMLYAIPVSLAAWYSGRVPAVVLAASITVANVLFLLTLWPRVSSLGTLMGLALVRGSVIAIMALWFARLSEHERQLDRYVKKLEGLLPICSVCKSIRNEGGAWEPLERFISTRSEAEFSHGVCPTCLHTHYAALDAR